MDKITKNPASALVALRWEKTSEVERHKIGKKLAAIRWKGHVAKRPASSRRKKYQAPTVKALNVNEM